MVVVLIAGIGLLVAGLATIGLGIELDLSFGNTLLLAGVILACTGVLMLGLWIAVRELKAIARQLGAGPLVPSRAENLLPSLGSSAAPGDQAPEDGGFSFSRDQQVAGHAGQPEPAAPPWHGEATSRGRGEVPGPVPAETAPAAKPRRNLLFSTSSRKERERAQGREAESAIADSHPGIPDPTPPLADPGAVAPASFDDAWPKPERARSPEPPLPRRGRTPSTFAEAGAAQAGTAVPAQPSEDQPQVTVLKSGVVDGMAYSLYSDGSIEAQMPEGMMRFASIDELRAHLDQRP